MKVFNFFQYPGEELNKSYSSSARRFSVRIVSGVVNGDRSEREAGVIGRIGSATQSLLITHAGLYGIMPDCRKAVWIVFSLNVFFRIELRASRNSSLLKF